MKEDKDPMPEMAETLFVQTAHAMTTSNGSMTLHGLTHATLFFTDRPERIVGHLSSRKFIDQWPEGEDSFAADPPNAVLSFLGEGDEAPEEVTVVLRQPQLVGNVLTYSVDVLDGKLPTTAGPCSLFIDPIGRPLSPMSVAGMRRRQVRRGR